MRRRLPLILGAAALVLLVAISLSFGALPFTPNETYIPNSPPVVKAATLNDLQTFIIRLFTGSHTVRSLRADGTGNVASSAPGGAIEVTRKSGSATMPSPATLAGQLNVGSIPYAVRVDATGGLVYGQALKTAGITKTGTGQYDVTFLLAATSVSTVSVKAQTYGSQRRADITNIMIPAAGEIKVSVEVWNTIAAPETRLDSEFWLFVSAE